MKKFIRKIKYFGVLRTLQYFFFQRVLLINYKVPWPVHWSSIVNHHENITQKEFRPYLGAMPSQYIQAMNGIEIGLNLRIGPGVKIISANHDLHDYSKHKNEGPIIIGDNCWLSANSILLPGTKLGDHVVVAAGSVVTKSFESNHLIGGNPAKIIKKLDSYIGNPDEW